ncbi:hypothetical protein [Tardiphaga sp. 11_C7_N12_6]|uniref:hypothetical protein n=1 Tax=Tardiphaga sp. 11_C7_N12_6 TaxID=3240789 RepID=UPI003F2554CB
MLSMAERGDTTAPAVPRAGYLTQLWTKLVSVLLGAVYLTMSDRISKPADNLDLSRVAVIDPQLNRRR